MMMPESPVMSRRKWLEEIRKTEDFADELSPDESWDRLKYYSMILYLGTKLGNIINSGYSWMQNTKTAEGMDVDDMRAVYYSTIDSLRIVIDMFDTVVSKSFEAEPRDTSVEGEPLRVA